MQIYCKLLPLCAMNHWIIHSLRHSKRQLCVQLWHIMFWFYLNCFINICLKLNKVTTRLQIIITIVIFQNVIIQNNILFSPVISLSNYSNKADLNWISITYVTDIQELMKVCTVHECVLVTCSPFNMYYFIAPLSSFSFSLFPLFSAIPHHPMQSSFSFFFSIYSPTEHTGRFWRVLSLFWLYENEVL